VHHVNQFQNDSGPPAEILAETDASGNTLNEYIFFGGKRIALLPAGSTAQYYVEDSLGSSRIVTTNTGVVCYDADFYPYGGERPYTDSCTQNNYKFEGKERDTETGNDDFGARYYSWRFGRWLSADWSNVPVAVPYANLSNPQTLNLYTMVADDPESFADLDGHQGVDSTLQFRSLTEIKQDSVQNDGGPQTKKTLNLCAQTPGCSQKTDKNGVTTVTVVSKDATVNTNKDGSITTTSTTTTQTYTFDQSGNMTNGHQQTVGTQLTMGPDGAQSNPINASSQLALRDAMHQFGAQYAEMFQNGFADTRGMWARYPGAQWQDIKNHPGRYARDVGTIVGAELIGGPVGGVITALHALNSAYELEKEVH
jgi:RHS repeat-associated protein